MKNIVQIIIVCLFFASCKKQVLSTDVAKINGYWEIEKVVLANGYEKDYKINETIDFFKVDKNVGFRKKVMPQFNGRYLVNDVVQNIEIKNSNEGVFLEYNTKYGKWQEEIIELTSEKLVLENDSSVVYHYKKSIPFSVK